MYFYTFPVQYFGYFYIFPGPQEYKYTAVPSGYQATNDQFDCTLLCTIHCPLNSIHCDVECCFRPVTPQPWELQAPQGVGKSHCTAFTLFMKAVHCTHNTLQTVQRTPNILQSTLNSIDSKVADRDLTPECISVRPDCQADLDIPPDSTVCLYCARQCRTAQCTTMQYRKCTTNNEVLLAEQLIKSKVHPKFSK